MNSVSVFTHSEVILISFPLMGMSFYTSISAKFLVFALNSAALMGMMLGVRFLPVTAI